MLLGALLVVLTGVELAGACELDSAVVELATGTLELVIELDGPVVRGTEEVEIGFVLFASGMLLDVVSGIIALLVVLATGALELAIELDGPVVRGIEEVETRLVLFASGMLLDVVSGIVAVLVVLTTELMEVAGSDAMLLDVVSGVVALLVVLTTELIDVAGSDAMLLVLLTTGGISVGPMEVVGMASLLVVFEKIG